MPHVKRIKRRQRSKNTTLRKRRILQCETLESRRLLSASPAGRGQDLLLIVDPENEHSLRIAAAYQELRHIPENNILLLTPPKIEGFTRLHAPAEEFWEDYVDTVWGAIQERGLADQIDFIAAVGQPHSFNEGPNFQSLSYGLSQLDQYQAGLTVSAGQSQHSGFATRQTVGALHHTDAYEDVPGSITGTQTYYVAGLVGVSEQLGNTPDQIIAGLRRSVAGDGTKPIGTVYFAENDDRRSNFRESQWPAVQAELEANGIPFIEESDVPGSTPLNRSDVRGAVVGGYDLTLPNGSTFLPGAWADNLTSFGGVFTAKAQTKATEFIAAGAAATSGTIAEPGGIGVTVQDLVDRFPHANLFNHIDAGLTLGEAYYQSVVDPDMLQFIGDILAQPYADIPEVNLVADAELSAVSGQIVFDASAMVAESTISRVELYLDGLLTESVAGDRGTFNIDTRQLSDGLHEFRVVAVSNTAAETEGIAIRNLLVNNQGHSIASTQHEYSGAGNESLPVSVQLAANGSSVDRIELRHLGRVVGSTLGTANTVQLDLAKLAFSSNRIAPVAVLADGQEVQGIKFSVVRRPVEFEGRSVPEDAQRSPGIRAEYFIGGGSTSIAASDFSGTPDIDTRHASTDLAHNANFQTYATTDIDQLAVRLTGSFTVTEENAGEYLWTALDTSDSLNLVVNGEEILSYDNLQYGLDRANGSTTTFLGPGRHDFQILQANTGVEDGMRLDVLLRGPDGISRNLNEDFVYTFDHSTLPPPAPIAADPAEETETPDSGITLPERELPAGNSEAIVYQSSFESEDAECWTRHIESIYNGSGCGDINEIYDGDRIGLVETNDARTGIHAIQVVHEANEDRGAAVIHLDQPTDYIRTEQYLRFSENYDFGYGQKIHRIWGSDDEGLDSVNFIVVPWGQANDGLAETDFTGINDTRNLTIVSGGNPNHPETFRSTESDHFELQRDQWHKVVTEVQLNAVGQSNGWVRLTIDDVVVVEGTGIGVRDSENDLINRVMLGGWYSNGAAGLNPSPAAASETTYLIDDVSIFTSPSTEKVTLDRPTNISPSGTTTVSRPPISWTPVDSATSYDVRLVHAATDALIATATTSVNSFTPSMDLPDGRYRVEVRATAGNIQSDLAVTEFQVETIAEDTDLLEGTIYFVSPNHENASDSNPGTEELPLATYLPFVWSYGQTDPHIGRIGLEAGDRVVFGEGTIDALFSNENTVNGLLLRDIHGTEDNPIVLEGLAGAAINSRNPEGRLPSIRVANSSHVRIEGFEISGDGRGIRVEESENIQISGNFFNEVEGLDTDNQAAIEVLSSSEVLITENLIVDSYDREAASTGGQRTENSRAIVLFSNTGPVQIEDNVILNTPPRDADITGGGITIKHPGNDRVEISDNVLINVATVGIGASSALHAHHNLLIDSASFSVRNFGSQTVIHDDIQIEYNTVVNTVEAAGHHDFEGNAGGFEYLGDPDGRSVTGDVSFENNLVYDSRSYNIDRALVTLGAYQSDDLYRQIVPGLSIEDNGYFNPNHPAQFNSFVGGGPIGGNFALAEWQSQGFDGKSVFADPLLDELTYFPENPDFTDRGIYGGEEVRLGLLIADDDRLISEGQRTTATLTRSGANVDLNTPLTIQLWASSDDVQFPSLVTIPAGENSVAFSIVATNDSTLEGIEAVRFDVVAEGIDQTRGDWLRIDDSMAADAPSDESPIEGLPSDENPVGEIPDQETTDDDAHTSGDPVVEIDLTFVDQQGQSIQQAQVGDTVFLVATTQDLRESGDGVFSVYLDTEFNSNLANLTSGVQFSDAFNTLTSANFATAGLIDEVGAVVNNLQGVTRGEVFRIAFELTMAGDLEVTTNPADQLPEHEISVVGDDQPLSPDQIIFGDTTLEVVNPRVEALDDQVVSFNDGERILIDVLQNDSPDAQLLSVGNVSGGTATIVNGQIQLVPDPSFFGELTFSYEITGPRDQIDSADVHLTLERRWQNPNIATDVSGDGNTSPIDALQIINFIRRLESQDLPRIPVGQIAQSGYVDVNDDGRVTALDALLVINHLDDRHFPAESELVNNEVPLTTASPAPDQLPLRDIDFEQEDPRDELFAQLAVVGGSNSLF